MAGKSKSPVPAPITASTMVPHTKVTYGQLCHTRRIRGGEIKTGVLLARNGAWENKAVVAYVHYNGEVEGVPYTRHSWTLGLLPLGKLFADGRMKPGKAENVREVNVEVNESHCGNYEIGGWCTVECFEPSTKKPVLLGTKDGQYESVMGHMHKLVDPSGGPVPEANKPVVKPEAAPESPESVLAEFLIPAAGENQ